MNNVQLAGNVGKDPDIKEMEKGVIVNLTLATGTKDYTVWHRCVAFNKTADLISKYVKKGSKIAVVGRINYKSWEKPDGSTAYATEIILSSVTLMDSKAEIKNLGSNNWN